MNRVVERPVSLYLRVRGVIAWQTTDSSLSSFVIFEMLNLRPWSMK